LVVTLLLLQVNSVDTMGCEQTGIVKGGCFVNEELSC
jgi:hypothetical protein